MPMERPVISEETRAYAYVQHQLYEYLYSAVRVLIVPVQHCTITCTVLGVRSTYSLEEHFLMNAVRCCRAEANIAPLRACVRTVALVG
jgi:hypothetical protein